MCTIVGREGTARMVVIPALVQKISQENERGLETAPSGAQVNCCIVFTDPVSMGKYGYERLS